jgi:acyl-CoA thioesterase-1
MVSFGRVASWAYGAIRNLRNLAAAVVIGAAGAATEPVTIAALGDSLTQGYGLPEADGLVPQLQGWLDAQGAGVRLVNAGVSGDTTAGGLSRIGWTLTP